MSSERKRTTKQTHWSDVRDKKPKIEELPEPEAESPEKARLIEFVENALRSWGLGKKQKVEELSESEAEIPEKAPLVGFVENALRSPGLGSGPKVEELTESEVESLRSPVLRESQLSLVTKSGDKFIIVSMIDEGTFGKVYRVIDKNKKAWALRVSKKCNDVAMSYGREQSMMELIGTENHKNLMPLCTFGEVATKVEGYSRWMVLMPLLGPSIRDVMEGAEERTEGYIHSFPVEDIFTIGKQLLEALEVLDKLKVVHLDLKPENIIFNSPLLDVRLKKFKEDTCHIVVKDLHIKLVDYSKTTVLTEDEEQFGMVQTRYYRAPEIFLGLPYIETTDIWSVGCILAELYTGEILFKGPRSQPNRPADIVQFFMMMDVLDKEPSLDQMAEAEIMQSPEYLRIVANRSWEDQVGPFPLLKENIREDDTQENVEYLFIVIDYLLNFDAKRRPPAYYAKKYL
ncbi:unnamed protein product [Caenorhabditis sp. 36 PRJEB53466]|nr:unnamed protein product [Caenorhabditis sp. 36 PRJEB53466]